MSLVGKLRILGITHEWDPQGIIVKIPAARIKTLRANPYVVVPRPNSNELLILEGGLLLYRAGSEVMTTTGDNLVVRYTNGSGPLASSAVECTGFVTVTQDTFNNVLPKVDLIMSYNQCVGQPLVLHNAGNAELGGNISNDSELELVISYRKIS